MLGVEAESNAMSDSNSGTELIADEPDTDWTVNSPEQKPKQTQSSLDSKLPTAFSGLSSDLLTTMHGNHAR